MYFGRRRVCIIPVVRVEDDPTDITRVIVTDRCRNRANMTISSYYATCRLADGAQVSGSRLFGWDR